MSSNSTVNNNINDQAGSVWLPVPRDWAEPPQQGPQPAKPMDRWVAANPGSGPFETIGWVRNEPAAKTAPPVKPPSSSTKATAGSA